MIDLTCLKGKKVVLTGAYGVFGVWIAKAFTEVGAELCLTGSKMAKLEHLAAELDCPVPPLLAAVDLTADDAMQRLTETVRAAWGAPDILINNAGVYPSSFLLDLPNEEWDRIMNVNLRAPFILSRDMAKLMIERGVKGSIINISSGAARKMRSTAVPYCVSKTALDRLNLGLALELAEFGIRVNAVEPGFAAGSESTPLTEEHVRKVIANIPLGRPSGPTDAPSAILYLCSEAASFITGANLAVDGGNSAGVRAVYQEKKRAL